LRLGKASIKFIKFYEKKNKKTKTPPDLNSHNNEITFTDNTKYNKINSTGSGFVCRICYGEEDNEKVNPLLNLCLCSGSLKYIHFLCLKKWITCKKLVIDKKESIKILMNQYKCEVCQSQLPIKVINNGIKYKLLEFQKPLSPKIKLEIYENDNKELINIQIISFRLNNRLSLGRSNDSDIRIDEISVSRFHSILTMFENKIYIDDHSSKFGTLVKITHPVIMEEDLIMPFQSGRTVFKAKIHNSFLMSKNILNFEHCPSRLKRHN